MAYDYSSEAILPAAECLFDKKKVTPAEIGKEFADGVLCVFMDADTNKKRKFVMGGSLTDVIGKRVKQHHDQRGSSYGYWILVGLVELENGQVVRSIGEDHRTSNLAFSVYK